MQRDCFRGIADPTRRNILLLLNKNELTVNRVAEHFEISRPAVSKHIKILEECGLLKIKQRGRERYCRVNPKPLQEVYQWLEHLNSFWDDRLSALKTFVEEKGDE